MNEIKLVFPIMLIMFEMYGHPGGDFECVHICVIYIAYSLKHMYIYICHICEYA